MNPFVGNFICLRKSQPCCLILDILYFWHSGTRLEASDLIFLENQQSRIRMLAV